MLKGTITKTSGRVHGNTIIDKPAAYERVRVTVCAGVVASQNKPTMNIVNNTKKVTTR